MDKAGRDFIEIETKPDLYFPQARTVPLPEKSIRFTLLKTQKSVKMEE